MFLPSGWRCPYTRKTDESRGAEQEEEEVEDFLCQTTRERWIDAFLLLFSSSSSAWEGVVEVNKKG